MVSTLKRASPITISSSFAHLCSLGRSHYEADEKLCNYKIPFYQIVETPKWNWRSNYGVTILSLALLFALIGCAGLPQEVTTDIPPCPSPPNAPTCKVLTDSVFVSVVETGEIIEVKLNNQQGFAVRRNAAATSPFSKRLASARDLVISLSSMERFGGPAGTHQIFAIKIADSSSLPYSVSSITPSADYLPQEPTAPSLSPDGRFLYVGTVYAPWDFSGAGMAMFAVDPISGQISQLENGRFYFPAGIWLSAMSPDGKLFCAQGSVSGGRSVLSCFQRDPESGLLFGDLMGLGYQTSWLAISPDSRYIAFTQVSEGTVSMATVDPFAHKLQRTPTSPTATGSLYPYLVAFHPNGQFLLVGHAVVGLLSVFNISPDGVLTPVPGSPFPFPADMRTIAISPSGQYLVATVTPFTPGNLDPARSQIAVYSFDGITGAISQLPSSPVPVGGVAWGIVACCTIPQ